MYIFNGVCIKQTYILKLGGHNWILVKSAMLLGINSVSENGFKEI